MRGIALAIIFAGLVVHTGLMAVAKEDPGGNTTPGRVILGVAVIGAFMGAIICISQGT